MPIILDNVTHTYSPGTSFSHTAISDINLEIKENEFVTLIGHTGSGKSTLIAHMNGLIQPTSGTVTIDDIDMSDKKHRKRGRDLVGMVFQYPEQQLFDETVEKDIGFGPKNQGLSTQEITERVRTSMDLVGLDYSVFADKSPFDLSGGEKRRAAIAGVIAMRPKYLVLDEPMAGLDPSGRKAIAATVLGLRQELGCAIVMISHSMDDAVKFADRVVVLNKGKILMDDTPKNVFSRQKELIDAGLGLPHIQRLSNELNRMDFTFPPNIFDADEMFDAILRRKCMNKDSVC